MPASRIQGVNYLAVATDDMRGNPALLLRRALRERLKDNGVKVGNAVDHGFCTSIYFSGPDNVQLEATYQARGLDEREFDQAAADHCGISAPELRALREVEGSASGDR